MPDPPMMPSTARVMTSPSQDFTPDVRLYCGAIIKHCRAVARGLKMPTTKDREKRRSIIDACRSMNSLGINQGTSGNISARYEDRMLVTPTSVPYDELTPEDICATSIKGDGTAWTGPLQPSSEWRFHLHILQGRPEVGAVVHTHSMYATVL